MKHLLTLILLSPFILHAQDLRIPGQVLDINSNPIENASISVVGINSNAVTDGTGIFSLLMPNGVKKGNIITLRIEKEGYNTVSKHIAVSPLVISIKLLRSKGFKSAPVTPPKKDAPEKAEEPNIQFKAPVVNSPMQIGGENNTQTNLFNGKIDRLPSEQDVNSILNYFHLKERKLTIQYQSTDIESKNYCIDLKNILDKQGYKNVIFFPHLSIGFSPQPYKILLDTAKYVISVELN